MACVCRAELLVQHGVTGKRRLEGRRLRAAVSSRTSGTALYGVVAERPSSSGMTSAGVGLPVLKLGMSWVHWGRWVTLAHVSLGPAEAPSSPDPGAGFPWFINSYITLPRWPVPESLGALVERADPRALGGRGSPGSAPPSAAWDLTWCFIPISGTLLHFLVPIWTLVSKTCFWSTWPPSILAPAALETDLAPHLQ